MPLNLAFYTDSYLPATDGVVSSILNFKKGLEKKGHNVYIFASCNTKLKKRYSGKNVFLYSGIEFKPYPQYSMALFPYNSVVKLRNLDIDMVHSHTPFMMGFAGMMSAKISRYPMIGSFHTLTNNKVLVNNYYPKNEQLKKFTAKYLWKYVTFFYKRCDQTIVPSEAIYNMLSRYSIKNINIVPNSVDTERFNPKVDGTKIRERLGIKDNEKVVLYLGRVSREKKLEVMLNAAKRLSKKRSDIKYVIGGSGPAEQYYKNMTKRLNLQKQVTFIGHVRKDLLAHVYAASDAFCLPSTFETQGMVSLEAMAVGKPVIGANYLALKDLIKNGKNGEKFVPGDYIGCSNKIERVLNNSDAYISGTISTAREFSIDKMTEKLLDVYSLVLSK